MTVLTGDDLALLSHQISRAIGRVRAADMHGWDDDRKATLRSELAALRIRKTIMEATDGAPLTAADADALAALIREVTA
jgi:hypothetical protein